MIEYNMPLYRPPAEANSFILQVTLGCSYNKCSFCTMYENKEYKVRKLEDIQDEIEVMARLKPYTKRVFLADGDVLNVDAVHILKILDALLLNFPKLQRVSAYASAFNLVKKTNEELLLLKEKKLSLVYYGIESGDFELLKAIDKSIKPTKMIEGLNKASAAGLKISAMVILGLGGKSRSKEHIHNTAALINACKITYLSTLELGFEKNRKDLFYKRFEKKLGEFTFLTQEEMLKEQVLLISLINPPKAVIFRSNHASNTFALKGVLPKDKLRLMDELKFVLKNYDLSSTKMSFE